MSRVRRPAEALLVALLLCAPTLFALLQDDLGVETAAVRFLLALGLASAGLSLLDRLVQRYDEMNQRREALRRRDGPAGTPQRRRDDAR